MGVFNVQLQQGDIQTDLVPLNAQGQQEGILFPGNSLYSPGQTFRLMFQLGDCDIVVQEIDDSQLPAQQWNTIWSLRGNLGQEPIDVSGNGIARITMQFDGNLVRNDAQGTVKWASGTNGNQGSFLRVQDDGNAVIYTQAGQPIWATNTFAGSANRPQAGKLVA